MKGLVENSKKVDEIFFCMFDLLRYVSSQQLWSWQDGQFTLRPKSTAMVMTGRSVHLTTLVPGQA